MKRILRSIFTICICYIGYSQETIKQISTSSNIIRMNPEEESILRSNGFITKDESEKDLKKSFTTVNLRTTDTTNVKITSRAALPNLKMQDTKGELSVSNMGSAVYTIPIAIPPGIKDIAPQISLVYDSNSGNGIAGWGWNISGISSINREGKRIGIDGSRGSVNLNLDDRYSLDGQCLMLRGQNQSSYGKNDTRYYTEIESNLKILSHGSTLYPELSTVNIPGAQNFKVTFPDGSIALYGTDYNSRTLTNWNIVEWKDAQGNKIYYEYGRTPEEVFGNHIKSIKWDIGNGSYNEIKFHYIKRNSTEKAHLVWDMNSSQILKKIEVFSNKTLFK